VGIVDVGTEWVEGINNDSLLLNSPDESGLYSPSSVSFSNASSDFASSSSHSESSSEMSVSEADSSS